MYGNYDKMRKLASFIIAIVTESSAILFLQNLYLAKTAEDLCMPLNRLSLCRRKAVPDRTNRQIQQA